MSSPLSCLPPDVVVAFAQGQRRDDPAIEQHLAECEECCYVVAEAARSLRTLEPGQAVGRYQILHAIGSGGMGVVYAALDPDLDRKVALKLLRANDYSGSSEDALEKRLLREAKAMARLSHENVVVVHDVGRFDGNLFLAMQLVEGRTLRQWMQQEAIGWRKVVEVFLEAGQGLVAAHDAGLVHRDFKPENVLIDQTGRVRVTDFGLAHPVGEALACGLIETTRPFAETLTRSGVLAGTPYYMAPEQFKAQRVDSRADQFSFCVALYEALHGTRPFDGSSIDELAAHVVDGRITAQRRAEIPEPLCDEVERGLRPDPADRHPSMKALLDALRTASARRRSPGHRKKLIAACAIVGVAVAGGIGWNALRSSEPVHPASEVAGPAIVAPPAEPAHVEAARPADPAPVAEQTPPPKSPQRASAPARAGHGRARAGKARAEKPSGDDALQAPTSFAPKPQ